MRKSKKGFTLVELIIVIAIIAILAVISFLRINKWLGNARDTSRKGNLANIDEALQIYLTEKTSLPKPDDNTMLYASGMENIVGYQGYFGETAKDTIGNINKAPKDGDNFFAYYVNSDMNKYQLMAYMENPVAYNQNIANAENFSKRYIYVRGDKLGIITDEDKNSPQMLGITGLDVLNTTGTYVSYLDNSIIINGTGKNLITILTLNNKNIARYDTGLVGYWDMETTIDSGGTLIMKDFSVYGNNGTCYDSGVIVDCGNIGPKFVQGKIGKAVQFDGGSGVINLGKNLSITTMFNSGGTISARFFANTAGEGNLGRILTKEFGYSGRRYLLMSNTYGIALGQNFSIAEGSWGLSDKSNIFKKRHNVVVVYDNQSSSNEPKFYIDGDLISSKISTVPSGTIDSATNADLCIGNIWSEFRTFDGIIDDIRLYNRILNDDEVKALYNIN